MNTCLDHLFWRNTKASVANEYELPSFIEDLVLLNFTPIESVIYQECIRKFGSGIPSLHALFLLLDLKKILK